MQYLKDEVREKILSSALIEFKNNGYLDASMRNIASRSGIALGSTYRYFKNKEELFNTLIEPIYDKLLLYIVKIQVQVNNGTNENCPEITKYIIDILNNITSFVKESNNELLIIFNKSKGSKFENFKKELIALVDDILIKYPNAVEIDDNTKIIVYTVSHDLVEGISFILDQDYDGDKVKTLINRLFYFYIADMDRLFNPKI